ncbi:MAG: hypothetical protein DRN18_04540, partial [Thermoplasmata archaeon]
KVRQWPAKDVVEINGDDPYEIASKIALHDWSYSDSAVIAVIDDKAYASCVGKVTGELYGEIPPAKLGEEHFVLNQTNRLNPVFHEFEVSPEYRYIKAEVWWDCILFGPIMIPTGDPDVQLYCYYNGNWMQSSAASNWNVISPPGHEYTFSYVYKPGKWRVGVTDFPTEGNAPRKSFAGITVQGSLLKALLSRKVTYHVDITKYPGVELKLPAIPLNSRDAKFILSWDNPNVCLGFSLIGPAGEVILTEINESAKGELEIDVEKLGGCLEGENYSIAVFSLNETSTPITFKISFDWTEVDDKKEKNSLSSAAEGSILASLLNAPLLYTSPDDVPDVTMDALRKLGVNRIHLVGLESKISSSVVNELKGLGKVKLYREYKEIYDEIREISKRNDVIFTTIDPWTYWYVGELKPAGEWKGALFVGPASYLAAHHGSPVIIIENHPRLSSAVVWHNEFWRRYCDERYDHTPSVAEMYLTGKRIYSFLKDYGFDQQGLETIVTVADQYDIGIPWDRIFPGVANSGRICGSPIDTAYWISRTVFYPALIFVNPALSEEGVKLINGSVSMRTPLGIFSKPFLNTLKIVRESGEERFKYPVLCSFVTHKHRFNERASKYYGAKYQCADGYIPGETETMEPIDQGVMKKYLGSDACIFPDLTESEVVPFYLRRGGFSVAFSTNFSAVTTNLNRGVILWIHGSHGLEKNGGETLFWDPDFSAKFLSKLVKPFAGAARDPNPWRGYEWYLGSTEEPDTMSMDIRGILPFTNLRVPLFPAMGLDWVLARKPIREFLNRLIPFVDPFKVDNLYDGVIGTIFFSRIQYKDYNGTQFDEALGNLHSAGFITSICQTSNTFFHLTLIRHGSVFQVQDPWPTSWYGAVWRETIPRDIALGYTVGEAFTRG